MLFNELLDVLVCVSCLVLAPSFAANTFKASDELKLRSYLAPARDSNVLPVLDEAAMANFAVDIKILPEDIMDLTVDATNTLWLDMVLCMQWNSSALMWNPQDFNNVSYTAFYNKLIWTPMLMTQERIIPMTTFFSYWRSRMTPVTLSADGRTEYCPQVHLPLSCSLEEVYDAFPTEEFVCSSNIRDASPFMQRQGVRVINRTSSRHEFGKSFSASGFELEFLTTKLGKQSAIILAGIRRDSNQWLSQVTIPVLLMSLLCLISLWTPAQAGPGRCLIFRSAFVAILIFQIEFYSAHFVHCTRPPVVLMLLQQLVAGQLVVAVLSALENALASSERNQQLYSQLETIYVHSVVHKYVEWARTQCFGWAFESFEDGLDLKESEESHEDDSPTNLISFVGIAVRLITSAVIIFKMCQFGLLFL